MVKQIKYNGEIHPISISYYAMTKVEAETGKKMADLGVDGSISFYEPMFFYALEAGYRAEKKIFSIKREDVVFMLDECWLDFTALMLEFFSEINNSQKKEKK